MREGYYNLYIEPDEEVTTIISRLHIARAQNVALIVPQHALVLQSIINLRLLVREAKKQKKSITLVTQDEEGMIFAKRVGIVAVPIQEWQENEKGRGDDEVQEMGQSGEMLHSEYKRPLRYAPEREQQNDYQYTQVQNRQSNQQAPQGDGQFREYPEMQDGYDELLSSPHPQTGEFAAAQPMIQSEANAILGSADEVVYEGDMSASGGPSFDMQPRREQPQKRRRNPQTQTVQRGASSQNARPEVHIPNVQQQVAQPGVGERAHEQSISVQQQGNTAGRHFTYQNQQEQAQYPQQDFVEDYDLGVEQSIDDRQSEKVVKVFYKEESDRQPKKSKGGKKKMFSHGKDLGVDEGMVPNSQIKKTHRLGWAISMVCGVLLVGYVLLPYTSVTVSIGDTSIKEEIILTAKTGIKQVDAEKRMIPVRKIDKEISRTVSTPPTGKKDVEAQKAYGTLKIYNTFSGKAQDLVATTRFESPDGVIFRLVKSTTVPGMKINGDTVEAGVVEVSVEADKVGTVGNVTPSKWTIPGFKASGQKYEKFYAESTDAMTGGSAGGANQAVATQADIDTLEKQANENLETYLVDQISALIREDEKLLSEAMKYEVTRSQSVVRPDTAVESVEYILNAKVEALVFKEGDLSEVIDSVVGGKNKALLSAKTQRDITHTSVKPDFEEQKLAFTTVAAFQGESTLDTAAFSEAIRNKRHEEIKLIIDEKFPFVSDVTTETIPPFPSVIGKKFSRYPFMTRIIVSDKKPEKTDE